MSYPALAVHSSRAADENTAVHPSLAADENTLKVQRVAGQFVRLQDWQLLQALGTPTDSETLGDHIYLYYIIFDMSYVLYIILYNIEVLYINSILGIYQAGKFFEIKDERSLNQIISLDINHLLRNEVFAPNKDTDLAWI